MKLFFENKKLRGLGYSVLRKQNTAIPQLWLIAVKDLLHHSSKKRKDEANTSPQIMPDTTQSLTSRLCRHIAPGRTRRRVQGRRKPLQKKHKIQLSPHIGNRAKNYWKDDKNQSIFSTEPNIKSCRSRVTSCGGMCFYFSLN